MSCVTTPIISILTSRISWSCLRGNSISYTVSSAEWVWRNIPSFTFILRWVICSEKNGLTRSLNSCAAFLGAARGLDESGLATLGWRRWMAPLQIVPSSHLSGETVPGSNDEIAKLAQPIVLNDEPLCRISRRLKHGLQYPPWENAHILSI